MTNFGRRFWVLAALSLGPAVATSFARFAYALILPAMRAELDLSYSQAGSLNTANALGYLVGALLCMHPIPRLGNRRLFSFGLVVTVLALLGLLFLLAGAFVLLIGSGAATAVAAGLPVAADAPLLALNADLPAWLPWAGAAAAVVVGLAALRWLVSQAVRVPPGANWQLADDANSGVTLLNTATAAAPLADEISSYPGVRAAMRERSSAGARVTARVWTWRIFVRPLRSGRSMTTWRSKRPGRRRA